MIGWISTIRTVLIADVATARLHRRSQGQPDYSRTGAGQLQHSRASGALTVAYVRYIFVVAIGCELLSTTANRRPWQPQTNCRSSEIRSSAALSASAAGSMYTCRCGRAAALASRRGVVWHGLAARLHLLAVLPLTRDDLLPRQPRARRAQFLLARVVEVGREDLITS